MGVQQSLWTDPVTSTCKAVQQWWLSDPADSTLAMKIQTLPAQGVASLPTMLSLAFVEQQAISYPLGSTGPIIQRGTLQAPTFSMSFTITTPADYATWQQLFEDGEPVVFRDDAGDVFYVVFGPLTTDDLLVQSKALAVAGAWAPHAITVAVTVMGG